MTIKAVVWGENVYDQTNAVVRGIYPQGMHATISAALAAEEGMEVPAATLHEPDHGLAETRRASTDVLVWWGHAAHDKVEDAVATVTATRFAAGHANDLTLALHGTGEGSRSRRTATGRVFRSA